MHSLVKRSGAISKEDTERCIALMEQIPGGIPRHRIRERRTLDIQLQALHTVLVGQRDDGEEESHAHEDNLNPTDVATAQHIPSHNLYPLARKKYAQVEDIEEDRKQSAAEPGGDMDDKCAQCGTELKLMPRKSIMVCDKCGYSEPYIDTTINALPYKSNVEITNFSYKKINHFNEWLLQVQGKEGVSVPQSIIDKVRDHLTARNVCTETISTHRMREALKELKLSKMYHHVAQITAQITGVPPPKLTVEVEEKCRLMFVAIQEPFEIHCPPERKNFLSYPYCLFKFLELLGQTESLHSFILLKGKDKLMKQDQIFQKICHTLNWEFIPSI